MTIKIAVICAIIALFTGRTYAQQNTAPNAQNLKLDYTQKVEKYRKMRGAGSILTVVGSILVVAGVVTMANSMDDYMFSDSETPSGTGLIIGGYVALGAGIPLWIVGGVQHKKYSEKLNGLSLSISSSPRAQGLTLRYRF